MSRVIDLLKELVMIDSINPFKIVKSDSDDNCWLQEGNEQKISAFLENKLEEYGFKTERQYVHRGSDGEKFYNILAEKGNGHSSILFYAHMDTVTANPWSSKVEALTPRIVKRDVFGKEKETLVALGANDMKAGIALILEAFKDSNPQDYKIKVAFGVDEEFYSRGGNVLANSGFLDDVIAAVVPEIGDGPNKFYGAGTIGIGRLGRCEFIIDVHGTGGHGAVSSSPDFINAAFEGAKIVTELEKLRLEYKDEFVFFEKDVPDKEAVKKTNGSFFVSRLDCGDGSLSIPSTGQIIVDCTFTPNTNIENLQQMLTNLIDRMYEEEKLRKVYVGGEFRKSAVSLRKRPTPFSGAYLTGEEHPFTEFVRECVEDKYFFMNYNMGYSVADENVFRRVRPNLPVLVLGPTGENSHKEDEWVDIESVEILTEVYRKIGEGFGDYISV